MNRFSNIFVPSDYVAPFDLGVYAHVAQQKEDEFNTNLNVLQSGLDQIASSTDLMRDADRQQFHSKLSTIVDQINQHGTEDLGDKTKLMDLQGMGRTVYTDPDIISAIGETQKVRKLQSNIEEDRKKGNLAPQNEYMFNLGLSNWLDPKDSSVGKQFTGSYDRYYDWKTPLLTELKNIKAQSTITIQGNDEAGIQSTVVKTKDLSESELMQLAQQVVSADPRALHQMQIDSFYKSNNMRPEDVTKEYQSYSLSRVSDLQNQIVRMTKQKEELVKNKQDASKVDGYISAAQDEMKTYQGYSDAKNTDATTKMIAQNKDTYYGEMFQYNALKGFSGLFTQHDESVTSLTNMKNLLDYKQNQALELAKFRAGLKATKGTGPDYVFNAPANGDEDVNGIVESQLINKKDQLEQADASSKDNLKQSLMSLNKSTYGASYGDPVNGNKNFNADYAGWSAAYDEGNYSVLPAFARDHFDQIRANNTERYFTNHLTKMVDDQMKNTPGYQEINDQLNQSMQILPEKIPVAGANGQVADEIDKKDIPEINDIVSKGDFTVKSATLIDKNGDSFPFKYKLLNGSSASVKKINAQIEKNVERAKQHSYSQNLNSSKAGAQITGQNFDSKYLGDMGVPVDESGFAQAMNILPALGHFMAGVHANDRGTTQGVGSLLDFVYGAPKEMNNFFLDKNLDRNGFYDIARMGSNALTSVKGDIYNSFKIANMRAVKVIPEDAKTQARIKPLVQSALQYFKSDDASSVDKVTNITRNGATGDMEFSYEVSGNKGVIKTVSIPEYLQGNVNTLYPENSMKSVEQFLQMEATHNLNTTGKQGIVMTPDSPADALYVPGTNQKIQYGYNPVSKEFYGRLYKGQGVWGDPYPAQSLDQVVSTVQNLILKSQEPTNK